MMQLQDIKKVGVVGAGTMGQGIAQISALAGYSVVLYDLQSSALDTAEKNIEKNLDKGIERGKVTAEEKDQALSNITFSTDFELLKADIIIEAIVERLDVKKELFENLENQNSFKHFVYSYYKNR